MGNLPAGTTSAQVQTFFSRFGKVARVLATRDVAGRPRDAYFVDLDETGFKPPAGGLQGIVFGGRPLDITTSQRTGSPKGPEPAPVPEGPQPLTVQRVQQYVWSRYVEFKPAPFAMDEEEALTLLAEHHRTRPDGRDAECFYLGILAYERSFGQPSPRDCLGVALRAFEAWREQVSHDFRWPPVDDRHADVVEQLQRLGRERR